jgi:hypothetical protein
MVVVSAADAARLNRDVRFTPENCHGTRGPAGQLRARNGHLDQANGRAKRHLSGSPSPPDIRMRVVIITKI